MYQRRSRKQFIPLWWPCVVGGSLFMCGKDLITPFYPPRGCCEAREGLFMCQGRSRSQFSPLWRFCEAGASLFMCGENLMTPF